MSKNNTGSTLESNQAAGTRLELLLFQLEHKQLFGINVFKVKEVIPYQPLTRPAGAHPLVKGMATLRGITMPIIDLSQAVGGPEMAEPEKGYIIITEYNRSVHGFLIRRVDRIVNTQWDQVQQLPSHLGKNVYVTAVTLIQEELVEILDVEKVLDQVVHVSTDVSKDLSGRIHAENRRVLVVDDSAVARHQIQRALEQLGIECTLLTDGKHAIDLIHQMQQEGIDVAEHFSMVVSDIEMPEMDGYQLTSEIRKDPRLADLYILLHSSISGEFNVDMVKRTGANKFIQKYSPDDLAEAVLERLKEPPATSA
ncbi:MULTISPECIES: chemotaxis protein CheV [Marichromatium]|uniref:Two-component system chemotaxis response regulator CheV n=1 Tax=Marichromatium gracile TaxID=1048 RepID=A0A4R4A5Y7_MARGR|nr:MULTISPECIES: chemotaxis protein CheV [Marichromatium]MBO8086194.1 chemotaxis protein CheV [Marichromatium sp.]MBK1708441.1 chemotaxis protein CheW [Marichromatium gracile]RNE89745.1 chemotaxis protein CheV [Marichromatium sp. AB31]RNE94303.1 chemotaxis protein CheV [Marichromatium sp. AB32]TCW34183.1 two-component system chemotaxis response regulator CheV [Marichromatium gracile]